MKRQRTFKITRLSSAELSSDAQMLIDLAYAEFEDSKKAVVKAHRLAQDAAAELSAAQAKTVRLSNKLDMLGGEHWDALATEPVWFKFKDDKGNVIFENPFTERDLRNAMRVQNAKMNSEAEQVSSSDVDMYREPEEEDGEPGE